MSEEPGSPSAPGPPADPATSPGSFSLADSLGLTTGAAHHPYPADLAAASGPSAEPGPQPEEGAG